MHQLTGLRIWTEYFVTVAAYTVSQGPFSELYTARTDEGGNDEWLPSTHMKRAAKLF